MNRWFGHLPIRSKLIALILMTSAVVVFVTSAAHLITHYRVAKAAAASDLTGQARLILYNAAAPLAFGAKDEAQETIDTLGYNTSVRTACLYDEKELFVQFRQPDALDCPRTRPPDGEVFEGNRIAVALSSIENGKRTGSVYIRGDVGELQRRVREQAIIIAAVMVVAFGVAVLMSARLQALVSGPIVDLSRAAAAVAEKGDYSVRAQRRTEDEVGALVDTFNSMLERIQARETDLQREVAERRRAEHERAELLVREREANRLKDEFLATLSHELRTPLNAILGWTKLLRSDALPANSVGRALEKVERNAQAQARLVEDLLEVSRITTGKLRLDLREVDIGALAATAIDSIRPAAEARGVQIERDFAPGPLTNTADPDRLQQVIWNLLSNAVKFTPPGGVVRISIKRIDNADEITVSDTGIGIDPAFLPHVFDTFRQADASATRAHGGLGLGLAIVRHLVELHGGTVSAVSAGLNQGASFIVRLPVQTIAPFAPEAVRFAAIPRGALSGTTILAVDDDDDTRELLQSVLESAGARVHAAGSADEALLACQRQPLDAIVTDIAMPDRDGYMLLQDLHTLLGTRTPRVAVALSAYAGASDRERSLEAGFQRHIAKPVDPVMLVQMLRELLDNTAPTV